MPGGIIAQISQLSSNDRVCGTPSIPFNEKNIVNLALKNQNLPKANQLKEIKKFIVGESAKFYTYNFETEDYDQINATLRVSESNINIWVEDKEWFNFHVTGDIIRSLVIDLLYETPQSSVNPGDGILNIIHAYFGLPPDFDGDGITDFLITDIIDGWEEGKGFIAGYFNPIDQYENGTVTKSGAISESNERDILYIDSYPGIFRQDSDRFEQVLSTISHEYQHLIHFNYDRNEETWMNEGLSELSSFLCGYGLRNPSAYLFNTGLELTGWDTDLEEALKHYAKTALWAYYLYEKFGSGLIKDIAQSPLSGPAGISAAFTKQGYFNSFETAMVHFFHTITLNNSSSSSLHYFTMPKLVGLKAQPTSLIVDYPSDYTSTQQPNSLHLYTFENGESLSIELFNTNSNLDIYSIKFAGDSTIEKETINDNFWQDTNFGKRWLKETLMVINKGHYSEIFAFNSNARQKYYQSPLNYYSGNPTYNITSDGNVNANKFNAPYDSCILKSVSFYNFGSSGPVNIYIFLSELRDGNNPEAITKTFPNILQGNWITLDLSDRNIIRNSGESFDIGVEYVQQGVMGYSNTPINLRKSYLKKSGEQTFSALTNYKVDEEVLRGVWMINMDYLAPLRHKPTENEKPPYLFTLERVGPTPFPVPGNPNLTLQYKLEKAGHVKIDIYDILGQRVITVFDGFEQGPIAIKRWDGRNQAAQQVASGQYFLKFEFEDQMEIRKIIVLR